MQGRSTIALMAASAGLAVAAAAAGGVYNTPLAPFTSPVHRRRVIKVKGGYTPAPTPNTTPEMKAWNEAVDAKRRAKGKR
jgi:hypothetical protein